MSPSLLFLFAFCISATWSIPPYAHEDAELHFENFIQEHGKRYADENEKQARFQIFKDNLEAVIRMNEKNEGIVYGITQFMDLTHEEFQQSLHCLKRGVTDYRDVCPYASETDIQNVDAPESFDWRTQNAVTPVKNQLKCGSCYAFSSIGNIESQYAIKYKQQIDLSEQQVVDCDHRNMGCLGGMISNVFRSLVETGGSESESAYPYHGAPPSSCQFKPSQVQVKLADCRSYSYTSQEKLKQLLYTNGPISIAIRASDLQLYKGGIVMDQKCTGHVNHAVLLVGYGTENGIPFWIVKNSWGSWGEEGYFRMQRGETAESCGMMNDMMASAILE